MRWPKFLNRTASTSAVKQEVIIFENESLVDSIELSSQSSDVQDHPMNLTGSSHPQPYYSFNYSGNASKNGSQVVYVPSSMRIGYSVVPASDFIQQVLRKKDSEIVQLTEQSKFIKKELQNYRLKYTETERRNHELQTRLSTIAYNNNKNYNTSFRFNDGAINTTNSVSENNLKPNDVLSLRRQLANVNKSLAETKIELSKREEESVELFANVVKKKKNTNRESISSMTLLEKPIKNEINCEGSGDNAAVKRRKHLATSTPLQKRKEHYPSTPTRIFSDLIVTPIGKNFCPTKNSRLRDCYISNIVKLDAILKKYELNISASLRILHNLVERKNPNPEDLFGSFCDFELINEQLNELPENECPTKKKISEKKLETGFLSSKDSQKFVAEELANMCVRAREILVQWDMFHHQLLVCIGSDVIKAPLQD